MSEWTSTTAVSFSLACIALIYIGGRRLGVLGSQIYHPLPPGPLGLPWVGNVFGINPSAPWITFAGWAKKYGDIIYLRCLGKDIIVINSDKVAKDLLETRSRNYSDRPFLITMELCGAGFNSLTMPYGDRWRLHRQFYHQTFRLDAVSRFLPLQNRKACHLLRKLFDNPEDLDKHVFEYTASIIMNCVYDYDPASRNDELVDFAANVANSGLPILRPDVSVVIDAFPFLLYLPSWFPGMSFKSSVGSVRQLFKEYLERPFEYSLQNVRNGSTTPSMVYDALRDVEERGISSGESWMQGLKEASGTAFLAASETSNGLLMTFFLMMMLNPAAQEKAQMQIDQVLGKTRLPTIEDRPSLPFVDAILRETFRHSPTFPLSFPHASAEDDVYNGFRIPKGAMIFANVWSMAHDESKYPNPDAFIPERFLDDDGSLKPDDITHIMFGFGRRICAGRHFADVSIWSVMAKVLAVFKILKPLDENGVEIEVEPRFSSGILIHPSPFRHRIVPRFFSRTDAEKLDELIAANT